MLDPAALALFASSLAAAPLAGEAWPQASGRGSAAAPSTASAAPSAAIGAQAAASPLEAPKQDPWRLQRAVGAPKWLRLHGEQRSRYEALSGQFRAGLSGNDQIFVMRTSLFAEARFERFELATELLDSRQYGADAETPLDTTIVNPLDFLQAYAGWREQGLFWAKDELFVLLGRHTMDLGNRRLVARNAYRNTINAFLGLNATYASGSGESVRAFYVLPTNRLPADFASLESNDLELDEESTRVQFFGLTVAKAELLPSVTAELSYFGLHERDGPSLATRNRELSTFDLRLFRPREAGGLDFEFQATYQFGSSRTSTSTSNTTDLDHVAHFEHLELGYNFESDLKTRLAFQLDYASGDRDPTDGENNRFDTLFGARRFEFGPTGIYGAIARANLISPGLRLSLEPARDLDLFFANRLIYLASRRDAWVAAGISDPSGDSGRYVGNQIEGALRWHVLPRSFMLEVGGAYIFQGSFPSDAPNANGEGDTAYGYLQSTFSF